MKVQWVVVLALVIAGVGCSTSTRTTSDRSSDSTDSDKPYSNRWASDAPDNQDLPPLGLLVEPGPASDVGYRAGWAARIELLDKQKITHVAVLGDMVIVVEDPENIVTALSAASGKVLWKTEIGSTLETLYKPSRDEDQVYLHSNNRFFTLRARDGKVMAIADLETSVGASAVYDPTTRLAFLSGSNGRVFAHNVNSNFTRWRYNLNSRITNAPALAQQDVFIVDTGGTYVMLEASSGLPLWRSRTLGRVRAAPAVQGSEVFIASEDGKLYAINRATGKDTWTYLGAEQPLIAKPITLGRLIIQPLLAKGGMVAIDSINGNEVWRNNEINATPVVVRQQDIVLYTENELLAVDLDDGELVSGAKTLPITEALPIGDDNSLLLVSPEGRLMRLNPL